MREMLAAEWENIKPWVPERVRKGEAAMIGLIAGEVGENIDRACGSSEVDSKPARPRGNGVRRRNWNGGKSKQKG